MDKLEQAMQSEDFWIELADTSFGKVILHGKNTNSIADNEYYEVSSEINTDGRIYTTLRFCNMEALDTMIKLLQDTKKMWEADIHNRK